MVSSQPPAAVPTPGTPNEFCFFVIVTMAVLVLMSGVMTVATIITATFIIAVGSAITAIATSAARTSSCHIPSS